MVINKFLRAYLAEFIGTALLVLLGLSAMIFINGAGSPVLRLLPGAGGRRALAGFLFGTTGCLIALSPVGEISGAHLNPMVSVAFWLRHNMKFRNMLGYIGAQMAGAALGCLPLLWWGALGQSLDYGATLPGSLPAAFVGEACLQPIGSSAAIYKHAGLAAGRPATHQPGYIAYLRVSRKATIAASRAPFYTS